VLKRTSTLIMRSRKNRVNMRAAMICIVAAMCLCYRFNFCCNC
jgi:hypothetical protein